MSLRDLLEDVIDQDETLSVISTNKEYILIDELSALHSGVKASQGSFSLPFDGWIVNDGKKISIEAATVAGDILKVLNSIVNIENEQIQELHQKAHAECFLARSVKTTIKVN